MQAISFLKYAFLLLAVVYVWRPQVAHTTPSLGAQPITSTYSRPYTADSGHGMTPSATNLDFTVWFGRDSGALSSNDYNADIWLVTNSANGALFSFGGNLFMPVALTPDKKIAAYYDKIPGSPVNYFGVNLGNVLSGGWTPAPGIFSPGEFYFYSSTITYNNLETDEWLFALGDISNNGRFFDNTGNLKDEFSPKTTSSTVPEPITLILFGTGLIGLAGYARRKNKK